MLRARPPLDFAFIFAILINIVSKVVSFPPLKLVFKASQWIIHRLKSLSFGPRSWKHLFDNISKMLRPSKRLGKRKEIRNKISATKKKRPKNLFWLPRLIQQTP